MLLKNITRWNAHENMHRPRMNNLVTSIKLATKNLRGVIIWKVSVKGVCNNVIFRQGMRQLIRCTMIKGNRCRFNSTKIAKIDHFYITQSLNSTWNDDSYHFRYSLKNVSSVVFLRQPWITAKWIRMDYAQLFIRRKSKMSLSDWFKITITRQWDFPYKAFSNLKCASKQQACSEGTCLALSLSTNQKRSWWFYKDGCRSNAVMIQPRWNNYHSSIPYPPRKLTKYWWRTSALLWNGGYRCMYLPKGLSPAA